jgi:hypothetical protein
MWYSKARKQEAGKKEKMTLNVSELKQDDRVYRYVPIGGTSSDIQPLTVVHVNRVTVTVRADGGGTFRMNPADIIGYVDWEE